MTSAQRRSILVVLLVPVLGAWLALAAGPAQAAPTSPINVTFDSDPYIHIYSPFTSVDSANVRFEVVDYVGSGPCDATTCPVFPPGAYMQILFSSIGGNRLAAANGNFGELLAALRMVFTRPTHLLRLTFQHEGDVLPGDAAVLSGFRNGQRIGSASVPLAGDANSPLQTIALQGYVIDSAVLQSTRAGGVLDGRGVIVGDLYSDPLCTIAGSNANNTLTGTSNSDVMCGGPGADTLNGAGGADLIFGDGGGDHLSGGAGNDTLNGGKGTDTCDGGPGTDTATTCERKTTIP